MNGVRRLFEFSEDRRVLQLVVKVLIPLLAVALIVVALQYSRAPLLSSSGLRNLDSGWTLKTGDSETLMPATFPLSIPGSQGGVNTATLYSNIKSNPCDCLVFRSIYERVTVYAGGELIYSYGEEGSYPPFFINPPQAYHIAPLPMVDSSYELSIELSLKGSRALEVPMMLIGPRADGFHYFLEGSIVPFSFGALMVLGSLGLFFLYLMFRKDHSIAATLAYLGLFALCAGLWVLCENPITGFIVYAPGVIYLVCYLALFAIPIALLRYIQVTVDFRNPLPTSACLAGFCVFYVAACLMEFAGIVGFEQLLIVFHILDALTIAVLIAQLTTEYLTTKKRNIISLLIPCGMLIFFTVLEILNYHLRYSHGMTSYFQMGLLVFIVCLAFSAVQLLKRVVLMHAVNTSLENLAYKDSLTNVRNRVAYDQNMQLYQQNFASHPGMGLVMLDLDGLKFANDRFGHAYGDKLIVTAARIICENFASYDVFRIGGDEFAVILKDVGEEKARRLLEDLHNRVHLHNESDPELAVHISGGYAFAAEGLTSTEEVFKKADERMYKAKLKKPARERVPR